MVRITKGDRYSVVLFTPENLHSRMSLESLDRLRQQGFPFSSTEIGLLANIGVLTMEGHDRCVQGRIPDIPNDGVDAYLSDPGTRDTGRGVANEIFGSTLTEGPSEVPGMTETSTRDTGRGVANPIFGSTLPEGHCEERWKSEQGWWKTQEVAVEDSDADAAVAD
eukprot:6483701-Amphidinium_carterae.1